MAMQLPPPTPGSAHAAASGGKNKNLIIVGGVVAALLVAGGVGFLVSRGSGGDEQVAIGDTPAFDLNTPPVAPVTPGAGDVPTPVTLPAPVVSAPVTTTPPATAPPVTAAPTVAPVIPTAPPVTNAPVVTSAPDPGTGGGTGGGPIDNLVDIGNGVLVPVPPGFEVVQQKDNFIYLAGAGGEITVQTVTGLTTAEAINAYITEILPGFVTDLEYSPAEAVELPAASIVDRQEFVYRGTYVSNQGGSLPIEGLVEVAQRNDGLIIVQDFTWVGPTADHTPPLEFLNAAVAFLKSFVYG